MVNFLQQPLGVLGAGTMGSGIALAALLADLHVMLYDVSPDVLARAREYIEGHLERKRKAINLKYLQLTTDLAGLRGAGVVIEAAPEEQALKEEIFARLDEICPPPAILATNTSTLSVTRIAAATQSPQRVAGMHFFNPAPVMPLVEVVRGAQTDTGTIQDLVILAEKMGKTPVVAEDTPGFIVNRVARPFYGEALRLLGEGAATHEQIDRIVREGGGFRMGPFQLMDLIGIDINFAATKSIYEQTFYEPRYRPHPIQARMISQQALGRKTGRGFYSYDTGASPESAAQPAAGEKLEGKVYVSPGSWAPGLEVLCTEAGLEIIKEPDLLQDTGADLRLAALAAGRDERLEAQARRLDAALPGNVPILCQCADVTLGEVATWLARPERLAGFDGLFLAKGSAATLVANPVTSAETKEMVEAFTFTLGRAPVWIGDAPGLVMPRLVCTLTNEATFAIGEGVANEETIDKAMQLGANYPRGPLAWSREIGYAQVLAVLQHLHREYGEERYRVAPYLRAMVRQAAIQGRG